MADKKDPAVLFYTADFLTGVSGLTMEERGQYITLLCLQHQQGALTEKQVRLSVGEISEDVRAKFVTDENGRLYNERMATESEKRKAFVESRRKASHSRFTRSESDTSYDTSYDNRTVHRAENENINENINSNEIDITSKKHKYGEYLNVLLTDDELKKLKEQFPVDWSDRIERLSEYIATTGKTYKSHLAVIRAWAKRDAGKPVPRSRRPDLALSSFNTQEAFEIALRRSYSDGT